MTFSFPLGRYCLKIFPHDRPVALRKIEFLRRISYGADCLFDTKSQGSGSQLQNSTLAKTFATVPMGTWSLSPETLNFLESEIHRLRPRGILEFGSGISTGCLAQYMAELWSAKPAIRVVSIEQNLDSATKTRELLRQLRLEETVKVFHAPLTKEPADGASRYTLTPEIFAAIQTAALDFVLIDGPAAEVGARYHTLPEVLPYLAPDVHFYLDDALRDGEIGIARRWGSLVNVSIQGIRLTGKGLLIGRSKRPLSI